MTFEQLLYVEVLSHYNSLQKAADAIHISKPGLSLAISQLEEELGLQIFKRTKRGTELTEEGIKLLATISKVLKSKAELEEIAMYANKSNQKKIVHIAYINTMFPAFINDFIKNYAQNYQNVYYDISRKDTPSIIQAVREEKIDVGFISSSNIESEWIKDLQFTPVCSGKVVLGVSPKSSLLNKRITFDDLKEQRFCLYDDVYHELLFDRLQFLCGPLNLIFKSDDHWAISKVVNDLDAVVIGRAIQGKLSYTSSSYNIVQVDIGHLINDNSTLGWLTNPRHLPSTVTKNLIDAITKDINEELKENEID